MLVCWLLLLAPERCCVMARLSLLGLLGERTGHDVLDEGCEKVYFKRKKCEKVSFLSWNVATAGKLTLILDVALVVGATGARLDDLLDLGVGDLLAEREQNVRQLRLHHRAVLHLVVHLEALLEVLESAHILVLLHLAVDGQKFLECHRLLAWLVVRG